MLLRVVAWGCLGLTGYCAVHAFLVPDDFGYILLGVPLVMVTMLARLEMQHVDEHAGLLPGRRATTHESAPLEHVRH